MILVVKLGPEVTSSLVERASPAAPLSPPALTAACSCSRAEPTDALLQIMYQNPRPPQHDQPPLVPRAHPHHQPQPKEPFFAQAIPAVHYGQTSVVYGDASSCDYIVHFPKTTYP